MALSETIDDTGLDQPPALLGVRKSARGFTWHDRLPAGGAALATAISQRYDLPDLLGRILAARGCGLDDVADTLDPRLKSLMPDPSTVRDMEQGAERFARAITNNEKVVVFGDYDVDGGSSAALVKLFLTSHERDGLIYIPDRIFEGYGPNKSAIEQLIADGAELIVTVDCGTTSHDSLQVARELGVDVIVIDHHQADENLPDVYAVINPNRQDDLSNLGHLCAAGVVFLFLVASLRALKSAGHYNGARRPPELLQWLDLVALATVCDVVPLEGLNRAYVTQGLQVMRHRRNVGLRALADVAGLSSAPTPYHLGFLLGPRINAGGRIGDAALGARLLSTNDADEADKIAATLDRLNRERKAMETETLEAALVQAELDLEADPDKALLITGASDWHKGLVGLVASRLSERFRLPALVLSWEDDRSQATGSLRSIAGVDIGAMVRAGVGAGLLVKGGGHAMAAGLTVAGDRYDAMEEFFTGLIRDDVREARRAIGLEIDGALTAGSVNLDLIDSIERAGPFGAGNPPPRFAFPAHRCKYVKVVGDVHIRCVLESGDSRRLDAIAFRAVGTPLGDLLLRPGAMPLHVAGKLKRDTWGGRTKIDLMIDDVADPAAS